jgi:hypothetical protein
MLTGVFYVNTKTPSFVELLNLTDEPLTKLPESTVRPPKAALDEIVESLR